MDNTDKETIWVEERMAMLQPKHDWRPNCAVALGRFRQGRRTSGPTPSRVWTLAAIVVAGLTVSAFPAPRGLAQRACEGCSALFQSLAATPVHVELKPEAKRQPAPDFTLTDQEGRTVSLSALRGKVVVLNFWATWCGGCKAEMPYFVEMQRTLASRGFTVIGVSLDEDGWKIVRPFLAAKGIPYPVVIGNERIATLYGAREALPVTVLIDRRGRIAASHTGVVSKAQYEAEVRALF